MYIKKVKIAIIRHSIRNRGGDRIVLDYLAYLLKNGHEVDYWTNEVNTHFPIDPKINIHKIPLPGVLGTILFTMANQMAADVLIVDLIVMAFFASMRNKKRLIYFAQDYDLSYHKSKIVNFFIKFCYERVLNTYKVPVISVSDGLSEKLKKFNPHRLITISNGVNLTTFKNDHQSPLLKTRSRSFVITLFAREDFRKGLDIGIKAVEELVRIRPQQDWEVWAIGPASFAIKGASLKHLGFMKSDQELRDVLNASDIYLVPSRSEGLSLLLLQALACQCVVVASAASYIIQDGSNGLISPIEDWESLANNLNRVMDEPDLSSRLKQNARILAEQFSLEKCCQTFEQTLCKEI
jgi:glycosyltransferase involved in cell wall biosynthesis